MITGNILICDRMTYVLFHPGLTYSHVTVSFALGFDLACDIIEVIIYVPTPIREYVVVTHV